MYTTVDQIEAILRLYKEPFDTTKYTTSLPSQTQDSKVVEMWQDQTWQDQTWQDQTWSNQNEFDAFIQTVLEEFPEFSVSPTTMFIYSVN
jgi:cytochrome c556